MVVGVFLICWNKFFNFSDNDSGSVTGTGTVCGNPLRGLEL